MLKRYTPDSSIHMSHELSFMRETPEGGYVAHGDYATLFSELELVKAERDAQQKRAEALAVENAALKDALSLISGCYGLSTHIQSMCSVETPATDAALDAVKKQAGIEAVELFADNMLTMASDPTFGTGSYRNDLLTTGAKAKAYLSELWEAK